MTKEHQHTAVIFGVGLLILLIVYLLTRRGSNTVVNEGGNVLFGGVALPALAIPRSTYAMPVIPNFGGNNDYNMIGACCADCAGSVPRKYTPPSSSVFVYNAGNSGPNIYYVEPTPPVVVAPPRATISVASWSR